MVWDLIVQAGVAALKRAVPLLNLPVVSTIINWSAYRLFDWIYNILALFIDFAEIKLLNLDHQQEYEDAVLILKTIGLQRGFDSPEFQEALESAKRSLSYFVRFNPK